MKKKVMIKINEELYEKIVDFLKEALQIHECDDSVPCKCFKDCMACRAKEILKELPE